MFCWVSYSSGNTYSLIVTSCAFEINLHSGLKLLLFLPWAMLWDTDFSDSGFKYEEYLELENKQFLLRWGIKVKTMACWDKIHIADHSENMSFSCEASIILPALNFVSSRNFYNTLNTSTRIDRKAPFTVFFCRFFFFN